MMLSQDESFRLFGTVYDAFIGLGAFMVASALALWPNSGRGDAVDRELAGQKWSDRIEFEPAAGQRTD
jgi:hypothetical protein